MECVLDLDAFGDLLGVELISPSAFAIASGFRLDWVTTASDANAHVSYDGEADALYVRIQTGRSARQPLSLATIEVDGAGRILELLLSPLATDAGSRLMDVG